ncbi:hypothetical protein QUB10_33250, partial [Microcoleus sp. B5-D4]|uniref:hypothetical protein n=1 Tax=Microcoleus sp. B5-D4 TaxID=2818681 RepID=UPI002FD43B6F
WVHKIPPKPIVTVEGAENGFECAEFTSDRLAKPHKPHQKVRGAFSTLSELSQKALTPLLHQLTYPLPH